MRAQAAGDLAPALGEDGVDGALGDGVAGDLLGGEDGFKLADEVGGADDLLAEGAQELDGAGVDHGDVHDGVVGRVLHGDAVGAGEHGLKAGGELLPAGVERLGAGQRVEAALLDAMDELARLALGGNEVVPAAGDVGLCVEAEDVRGDGVAVVMVVKEPAVEAGVAESRLDRVEIHTGIGYPVEISFAVVNNIGEREAYDPPGALKHRRPVRRTLVRRCPPPSRPMA